MENQIQEKTILKKPLANLMTYLQPKSMSSVLTENLPMSNQIELVDFQKELTLNNVFGSNGCINLRLYKVKFPQIPMYAEKALCSIISMYNESMSVTSGKMSGAAIYETATLIMQDGTENLEDLILCLRMAKEGKFGTNYNRVDTTLIMDYWSKYKHLKYANLEAEKAMEKQNTGHYRTEIDTMELNARRKFESEQEKINRITKAKNQDILQLREQINELKFKNS